MTNEPTTTELLASAREALERFGIERPAVTLAIEAIEQLVLRVSRLEAQAFTAVSYDDLPDKW